MELKAARVSDNSIGKSFKLPLVTIPSNKSTAFMFHIPAHVAITDYALNRCPNIHGM